MRWRGLVGFQGLVTSLPLKLQNIHVSCIHLAMWLNWVHRDSTSPYSFPVSYLVPGCCSWLLGGRWVWARCVLGATNLHRSPKSQSHLRPLMSNAVTIYNCTQFILFICMTQNNASVYQITINTGNVNRPWGSIPHFKQRRPLSFITLQPNLD